MRRMLLSSAGITNDGIRTALGDLVGQDFANASAVIVTTASTAVAGHLDWHLTELNRVYGLGWAEFNVLELNGLPRAIVAKRLESADVIYMSGGNAYHLARSIVINDLGDQTSRRSISSTGICGPTAPTTNHQTARPFRWSRSATQRRSRSWESRSAACAAPPMARPGGVGCSGERTLAGHFAGQSSGHHVSQQGSRCEQLGAVPLCVRLAAVHYLDHDPRP